MKKDKLYKVNKWNRPAFLEEQENLFFGGGGFNFGQGFNLGSGNYVGGNNSFLNNMNSTPQLSTPTTNNTPNWTTGSGMAQGLGQSKALVNSFGYNFSQNNALDMGSKADLDSSDLRKGSYQIGSDASGFGGNKLGADLAGALGAFVAQAPDAGPARDKVDPLNYMWYDGRHNPQGDALQNAGRDMLVSSTQDGDYIKAIIGGIMNIGGGLINAGWGMKTDKDKLEIASNSIASNTRMARNAKSLDDIGSIGTVAVDAFKSGWFNRSRGEEANQNMRDKLDYSVRDVYNVVRNMTKDNINNELRKTSAFGGPLDKKKYAFGGSMFGLNGGVTGLLGDVATTGKEDNSYSYGGFMDNNNIGALGYNFMDRYLTAKEGKQAQNSNMTNMFAGSPNSMFAIGGVLQSHGSDWSDGLITIGAGGTHEENKYDGVQLGVDGQNVPNLVEEGEVVFNDYVYSNRINVDQTTKEKFHLPKKKDITYADLAKKLEKEISERVNDPISKAGFKAQMEQLEEQQERQKQEMEAERAKAAFEALSPEEQTALMQRAAQEEAMAQQTAQQQAMAEQQAMQQPTPEEIAMAQQAQSSQEEALAAQQLAQQQAAVAALGGRLVKASDVTDEDKNVFAVGGRKARRATKKYDKDWFLAQAKSLGMIGDDATDIDGWEFNPDDPETNLSTFNNLYKTYQKNKALETYRTGQRKAKENELFGDNGLYSYSDDKSKIYKARVNDIDRIGWINADYTGELDDDGNLKGFISQEDYNKLSDKDKEAYKRIDERAGNRMYDYSGKAIKDLYDGKKDDILDAFAPDYEKDFKFDDKDVQTLQYPVNMEHSNLSKLRYVPALGGAFGLARDLLTSPDYSRAQNIIRASEGIMTPSEITPHYIGDYLTYKPMDIFYGSNQLMGNARATDRGILNSGVNQGTKNAALLANGLNTTIGLGNLYRQGLEYNNALKERVTGFNRGTNQFNADMDWKTQAANQNARLQAGRYGLSGIIAGNQMMDDIDARRGASMSANMTNLLQSIGNIGEEAYDEDRLKWLEKTGTLRSNYFGGKSAACGGKLKKKGKRGLTF